MEISPLSSSPSFPYQNAEQNLLELSQQMIEQIDKLKEALNQTLSKQESITNPDHLQMIAETAVNLDKTSQLGQQLS